jgi:Phage tail protein
MATAISFDGNDLQASGILTSLIDHESQPEQDMKMYALAHASMSKIPYRSYPRKPIVLRGTLLASGIAAMDALADTFRAYFKGKDKNLDIGYNSTTRRYVCTAKRVVIQRPEGLNHAKFFVELVATEPFGRDTTTTMALNDTGNTSSSYSDTYSFLGNAPYQQPIVTITYTALTGGTAKTVTFANVTNGQQCSITRTWATNDILIIDATLKKVTVNGTEVDFSGAIPEFEVGSQSFSYSDNLTTRTFNYNIVYYKRYF